MNSNYKATHSMKFYSWPSLRGAVVGVALLAAMILPSSAQALTIYSNVSPNVSANRYTGEMGNGIIYYVFDNTLVIDPDSVSYYIGFYAGHPSGIFDLFMIDGTTTFFLQSDSGSGPIYGQNSEALWGTYDNYTNVGYLVNGAQEGSDNWTHFTSNGQHVWAQFHFEDQPSLGSALPKPYVLSYAYSYEGDFTLSQAIAAVNRQTPSNFWTGDFASWQSDSWSPGFPDQSSSVAIDNGGTAIIGLGHSVEVSAVSLGFSSGQSGNVNVEGTLHSIELNVGRDGSGVLGLYAGGEVDISATAVFGAASGSVGDANIDGEGSILRAGALRVGQSGQGTLNISSGGRMETATSAFIGENVDGQGIVNISDGSSEWQVGGEFIVGRSGQGKVIVSNGGKLTSTGEAFLGHGGSGNGEVTVAGTGSTALFNKLTIGKDGVGKLTVSNGGQVQSSGETVLGDSVSGQGEVTVTGAGSTASFNKLAVGKSGVGKVSVLDGGHVTTGEAPGDFAVGGGAGSEVVISGAGSKVSALGGTSVGYQGSGTITLENDGILETASISLAPNFDASGTLNFGSSDLSHATRAGSTTASSITLYVRDGNSPTVNFNQYDTNTISSSFTTSGTINQRGVGTTVLTGNSSGYYGATNVTQGTLVVNGSLGGQIDVDGGTLAGTGTVENVTVGEAGFIQAGGIDGLGTLTIDNLTLLDNTLTTFIFNIHGASLGEYGQIALGQVDYAYGGITRLDINFGDGYVAEFGDTFQLFSGAYAQEAFIELSGLMPEGLYWNTTQLSVDGSISITNQTVPEPGTWALLGLGLVALLLARRHRAA